jgi:hypothetical protein
MCAGAGSSSWTKVEEVLQLWGIGGDLKCGNRNPNAKKSRKIPVGRGVAIGADF